MKRIIVLAAVLLYGSPERIWSQAADGTTNPEATRSQVSRRLLKTGAVQTSSALDNACTDHCQDIQDACLASGSSPANCYRLLQTCLRKCPTYKNATLNAIDFRASGPRTVEPPTCVLGCERNRQSCMNHLPPGGKPTGCNLLYTSCLANCSPPGAR